MRGGPDLIVVIDEQTLRTGLHEHSIIDLGADTVLPVETLRRMACVANIIPVVLDRNGVVLDARLLGTGSATKAQRRAMRAMYPSCGVPGCRVAFEQCVLHHIRYWENGGRTDLANLIPLCSKHHHAAHEGGWHLAPPPHHPTTHHHLPRRHHPDHRTTTRTNRVARRGARRSGNDADPDADPDAERRSRTENGKDLAREAVDHCAGLVAVGAQSRAADDDTIDAEGGELAQPRHHVLGRTDDAEPVDEVGRHLLRLRRPDSV